MPQTKSTIGLYDFDLENIATENEINKEKINNQAKTILNGFTMSSKVINNNNSLSSIFNNNRSVSTTAANNKNSNFFSSSQVVPGIAKPIIPDRSSKPKINNSVFMHNNLENNSNNVIIKNDKNNSDTDMSSHENNNKTSNIKKLPIIDRSELPPKPEYLTNGSNYGLKNNLMHINGYTQLEDEEKGMEISDDDEEEEEDLVAGDFDDLNKCKQLSSNINHTAIPRRKGHFSLDMSDDDDNDLEMNERPSMSSRSKPISMNRSDAANYSAPSSLSRSLSSPNIAQFDPESQPFSFNSVSGATPNTAATTPKSAFPQIDRSVKPLPYQSLLRKSRDFNPQYSSFSSDQSSVRIPGLRNLGNTCFMNSILQCLNNTTEFSECIRSGYININPNSKFGSNGELTIELMELFKQMIFPSNFKHISPKDLKNAVIKHIPDFVEYKQQDAHEFLVRFLDRVHADLNECANVPVFDPVSQDPNYYDKLHITSAVNRFWTLHIERNKSIITDLFGGLIVSTLTCLHGGYISKALEAFTCLSLPIQDSGRTSIAVSVNMFLKREKIEASWQCLTCKQKRDAEKSTIIWKLPKILVIHLKRYL